MPVARSLCCLHRAKALVPYDESGRRCAGERRWLNMQVWGVACWAWWAMWAWAWYWSML